MRVSATTLASEVFSRDKLKKFTSDPGDEAPIVVKSLVYHLADNTEDFGYFVSVK